MSGDRRQDEPDVEDLPVPPEESIQVKATGDVTGDGPAALAGDPDQPVVAARLPGLHKSTDVTLKRG